MTSPNFGSNPLGVCSWSVRADSPADLADRIRACAIRRVQLALEPIRTGAWPLETTRRALNDAGIQIVSGMIATRGEDYTTVDSIRATGGLRPDAHWDANLADARASAAIARELAIPLVTFHAGFLPESPTDPLRARMIERIGAVADIFAEHGIAVALETGQESPRALLEVLAHRRLAGVRVNFDPANMILYASADPLEALALLVPHVAQIHLKDALPPAAPGTWGTETPFGEGSVDWARFFEIVGGRLEGVPLMIERESGDDRLADIRHAADLAESLGASR